MNGQQPHQQIHRARQAQPHQRAALDTRAAKPPCQAVGRRIQLAIAQSFPLEFERRGIRGPLHLSFDQFVEASVTRVVDIRAVPHGQRRAVLIGEDVEMTDLAGRVRCNPIQELLVHAEPALNSASLEEVRVVLALERHLAPQLHRVEKQVEVLEVARICYELRFQTLETDVGARHTPVNVEDNRYERQPTRVAPQRELGEQLTKSEILVFLRVQEPGPRSGEDLCEWLIVVHGDANGQHVHEVADERVVACHRLPCHWYADYDVLEAGQAMHQQLEACEQRHEQARALARSR